MQENLSEDEIIAGCISYIESFYLGDWLNEPFTSTKDYYDNNSFCMEVAASGCLRILYEQAGREIICTPEGASCFPIEEYETLTQEMYGFSLPCTASASCPEGMAEMPYGYGAQMTDIRILPEHAFLKDGIVHVVAELLWKDYGMPPEPIGYLEYQLQYSNTYTFFPYTLLSISKIEL